jgi:hypothetical protein
MKKTYKQVDLQKGSTFTTVWIPSQHAVVGNILRIKLEDGWEVIEVYDKECEYDEIVHVHSAVRKHRQRTGDDIPKQKKK